MDRTVVGAFTNEGGVPYSWVRYWRTIGVAFFEVVAVELTSAVT